MEQHTNTLSEIGAKKSKEASSFGEDHCLSIEASFQAALINYTNENGELKSQKDFSAHFWCSEWWSTLSDICS